MVGATCLPPARLHMHEMLMIRLIALDLDQTVIGNDLEVSPRVRQAIAQARRGGAVITIATGREARLAARFARELGITSPIICAQGGCIYDLTAEEVLHEVRLPAASIQKILESARAHGWNIHFETADQLYFPSESNHPEALFELLRYSNWVRVGDLLRDMPELPYKVLITLNRVEDRARVLAEMRDNLGADLTAVPSHPHLIEGVPAGVNKAHGVGWLAGHLGIAQQDTLAIGDSEADIPMLEWAGVGVAMGNAAPSVKAIADWIAPSLERDGAAVAIEKFTVAIG